MQPAAQQVTAADIDTIASSLTTALAAGSTEALVSAVRQLSAATSDTASAGAEAQAAAEQQAENAMGAMESMLSGDGASVDDSLGVASAGGCMR